MINVVVPMAGEGQRFVDAGFKNPKPFIDVKGKPMIWHVLKNLHHNDVRFILIAREEHLNNQKDNIDLINSEFKVDWVTVSRKTEGTVCTVLKAYDLINNDHPLVIANSDQLIGIHINDFYEDIQKRKLDGSIMTFIDSEKNPKWSFARIDHSKMVVEVQEKKPISDYATVGIYAFSTGSRFIASAIQMIVDNERVNGEFYTCPVYNYFIKKYPNVGIFNIDEKVMHGLGTPADLDKYLARA